MKLRFLGTSAGIATRKRFNTAMLLRSETGLLLIDCGEHILKKMLSIYKKERCKIIIMNILTKM